MQGGQLSPDGLWQWNGTEWVPAQSNTPPAAAIQMSPHEGSAHQPSQVAYQQQGAPQQIVQPVNQIPNAQSQPQLIYQNTQSNGPLIVVGVIVGLVILFAIVVVLSGVLYVWASSLAEDNTDGNLTLISMTAEDAQGSPSWETDDALIRVTMVAGTDLSWAAISVQISIDNGAPLTCGNPGQDSGDCVLVQFGSNSDDQDWSVGEGVTIKENGQALCDTTTYCAIEVTITDTREGQIIDTSSAIAS